MDVNGFMASPKKILITGVSGLLGNNIASLFREKYDVLGLYNSNPVDIRGISTDLCDLCDKAQLTTIINKHNPHIVIHCASLTNVDECELDKELTDLINVEATKNIVDIIRKDDIKLIYISTDSVYNGNTGSYIEDSKIEPQNYYGLSKYRGEREVLQNKNALILRTNIFGWNIVNKESIAEWILFRLKKSKRVDGFKDAIFSSIYTMELAKVIYLSIEKDLKGIFNCGSRNSCSKYEFAFKLAEQFGFGSDLINPISIEDYRFRAKRGKNLSIKVDKIEEALQYRLPTIEYCIESFYRDYIAGMPKQIKEKKSSGDEQNIIPYGNHYIDENDIQAVVSVLRSSRITQGPLVHEFEEKLAKYCGAKYAVAVNSGTAALHLACMAAGLSRGDEAITSPITFVASANCIVYCGATPKFADIDENTYNLAAENLKSLINKKTKAIIPVHFAGQSCDMATLNEIVKQATRKYGNRIFIIEDGCHALGSSYAGSKVGSCKFSDMTVLSFHPVKHITTGEGGALLTNDKNLYELLIQLRSHGITSNPLKFIRKEFAFPSDNYTESELNDPNPWYYEQQNLGFNYRITDIQCALGISQLKKLENYKKKRRRIVEKYNRAFIDLNLITITKEIEIGSSNFHLYVLKFDFKKIGLSRRYIMKMLLAENIQTQVHYIPVHSQPYYQKNYGYRWGDFPIAEDYYCNCLSIPLFAELTDSAVEHIIYEVTKIAEKKV